MMSYIVESKVRKFINENGKQITRCGLHAIEIKFVEFLAKLCRTHNGGRARIDAGLVNVLNMK
jgi:hypothetical protein